MKLASLFSLPLLFIFCFSAYASEPKINDVYVIHFVLDGLNYDLFQELLASERIPTVKNKFVDNGAQFTGAITNFPSVSTAIYQSFTTGLFPGNAGIPHLEKFDRKRKKVTGYLTVKDSLAVNTDLTNLKAVGSLTPAASATIFELLKGSRTAAVYTSFRRGASSAYPKRVPLHALWSVFVEDSLETLDMLVYKKMFKIFNEPELPRYTLAGLYATDFFGHEYGAKSDEVKNAVIQFDRFLKEFLELLEKRGIDQKTYIIVSADHGMHDTGLRFFLQKRLKEIGVNIKTKNPKNKDFTLYIGDRGVASVIAYVKNDGSWNPIDDSSVLSKHLTNSGRQIDLISEITSLEPTLLVVVRDGEGKTRIYDNKGSSLIECSIINYDDWCSYKVVSGEDPLHYTSSRVLKPLLDGRPHPSRTWLKASVNERYPDAVIQLSQMFKDPGAQDFVVIAKDKWGFRIKKAATHGSLIRDDMHIPMMMRGPDVSHGTFSTMRACDVFALLIKWFGLSVPKQNFDGADPFEETKSKFHK